MVAPTPTRGRGGRGSRGGRARGGRWANHWATRTAPARAARASSPVNDIDDEHHLDSDSELEDPPRSRIVTLKVAPHLLRSTIDGPGHGSQSQEDHHLEPSTAQSSTPTGSQSQNPETPLRRRSKRALAVPESSRTTRQSARQSAPGRQSSRLKPGESSYEHETPSKAGESEPSEHDDEDDFGDDASPQKEEYDEDFKPQQRIKLQVSNPTAEHLQHLHDAASTRPSPAIAERETRLATTKLQDNELNLRPDSAYSTSAPTYSQEADSPKQELQSQSLPQSRGMSSPGPRASANQPRRKMKAQTSSPAPSRNQQPRNRN
ncbi:hypothetical protein N7509_001167 [Penicillium cosmopolitanum]|uniref:Uncharacterized protein n=1 Tax=Penicillium cosmopolitanum TaxID=1131564 RepID=A0A9W9WBT4_9EURO|nr:uncharacterized protein N7509_001167 [Penicillium cosmopolitanum]KAJ5414540.1 hypothetical protein N7509_001167 [Penicillium cosmopolitanum]